MEAELKEYEVLEKMAELRGWSHDDYEYKKRSAIISKTHMAMARAAARATAPSGARKAKGEEKTPRALYDWGKAKKGLLEHYLKACQGLE